ncbi:sialate O-acetylesterase [Klebsiella quasipneumoniae]
MSTYKTDNPLGSAAVKDLFDNAENLDFALNSLTALIWTDRLGKVRPSFFGMETSFLSQMASQESRFTSQLADQDTRFDTFIASSGYDIVGDYTVGTIPEGNPLTITEYNQIIRYNNELYKLTAATNIPFTASGKTDETWTTTDSAHFVSVGDAALRQNLGSSEGADIVGWQATTVGDILDQAYRDYSNVFDVFILYGQSNIIGYADNTPGYPSPVDNYVTYYNPATGQIAKVVPAMAHASGNTSTGHSWAAFGNEYRKQTGRKILFVPCGKGETALADFVPGTTLYNLMLTTVASAKSRMGATGRAIGKTCILFHQGEQDMTLGTTRQDYQDQLVSLVTGTSTDLSIDKFFFLRVGCPQSRTEESWSGVQAAQDFLCQSFNICNMAFSDFGKFTQGNGLLRTDGTHATQYGYNYMGQQAAKHVSDALMSGNPSTPAEMQMYGVPVLPQDQIWRYTYARAVKTDDGWVMPDRSNASYKYRTANILKMEVNDTYIRFYVQSRADWILDLDVDVNYLAKQYGVNAAVTFSTISTNIYALDVAFFADISFGCSKTGELTSAPNISPANSLINGNVSASVDSTHNSIVITHNGSQAFPNITGYAGGDYENTIGDVGIAAMSSTSFAIVNNGTGGVLCILPDAIIKPSTLLSGMQINVKALVCEKKNS